MNGPALRVRVEPSIKSITKEIWDACAGGIQTGDAGVKRLKGLANPDASSATAINPFVTHDFLLSLEESGAATARTGWAGRHLLVEDETGATLAAMPAYLKNHSRGEYVFDQGWAEAFERAGGDYYPKLQVCVPFTPVTGPRLLLRPGHSANAAREALIAGALEIVKREHASSLHITFPTESEWKYLAGLGFLARTDRQFHWRNEGYSTFRGFLAALSSRKRKMISRERREALADGVSIVRLTGRDLTEAGGRVLCLLHGHRLAQMGIALSQPAFFLDRRRAHARQDRARDGEARGPLHRRGAEFSRKRYDLRPLLGRGRAPSLSAF